jgi:hypothetical protein
MHESESAHSGGLESVMVREIDHTAEESTKLAVTGPTSGNWKPCKVRIEQRRENPLTSI